ncbi:CBS domain multi-pass transmembrane protein [Reticulomyxa filosa]|uniref:CBS domain multi-pass transmembrane protein n=1 Tax=Reticulomyxa filosa TaxID=46433 RepID=X6LF66_RETFI|nr:CBS domain multi-pass transmembrane protein [Reticulomyxa filosa]|eukprot:ETO00219.1 CBS domain multi-pass transmembrane protein [Reticulomyxa filosa]
MDVVGICLVKVLSFKNLFSFFTWAPGGGGGKKKDKLRRCQKEKKKSDYITNNDNNKIFVKGSDIGHYVRRKPVIMSPDTTMIQALNLFRERRTHFALITREVDVVNECLQSGKAMPKTVKFLGAITLEDIMEQLIQEEIEDEFDSSFDVKGITIEEQRLVTHQIFHKRPPHNISPKNQRAAIREKRTELKLKQLHQQQQLFKNVIEHGKAGTGTSELVGRSSTHPQEIVDNTNNKSAKGDVILSPEMETDSKEIEIESKSLLGTES